MILQKLYDSKVMTALTKGMDASHLRQAAISDNIANVNTPNYKRKRVSFETELRHALEADEAERLPGFFTHPGHFPINARTPWNEVSPTVFREGHTTWRNDGIYVDIDLEMSEEAKNTQQYLAYSRIVSRRFTGLKDLIKSTAR